jgi:hypothetical protein
MVVGRIYSSIQVLNFHATQKLGAGTIYKTITVQGVEQTARRRFPAGPLY